MAASLLLVVGAARASTPPTPEAWAAFRTPPHDFRPVPFWAWNDELDDAEIRRQVAGFRERGFGGFFVHARTGLATPYLGAPWFDRFGTAVGAARRLGLATWIYDDERWPSGTAGGRATHGKPEFRALGMGFEQIESARLDAALSDPSTLGVFEISGSEIRAVSRGDASVRGTLIRFSVRSPPPENWYNGEGYLDLLNERAVQWFLDLTYARGYDPAFRSRYGREIAGTFSDEPNFRPQRGNGGAPFPWTPQLFAQFERARGYSLTANLPLLVQPLPGFEQVRYDFWRTVTELFESSFLRPYGARTARLGLTLTGHFLNEETLSAQTGVTGSVMLAHLHQQMPGVDHLGLRLGGQVAVKQAASVARQFGKSRVLSELWGSAGHSATFEDLKWIADHQLALGVNFLCPHLSLYSMAGPRKRDHPPTISDHQPYWPYLRKLNDYLSRASFFVTLGRPASDVLVLEPLGSVWSQWAPGPRSPALRELERGLAETVAHLLGTHRDFDLGDELLLERFGAVEGGLLRVGPHGRYRTVVLPPATRWSPAVLGLLDRFLGEGGAVIARPARPESLATLARSPGLVVAGDGLDGLELALGRTTPTTLSIADESGREVPDILLHHRVGDDGANYYLLVNTNREQSHRVRLGIAKADGLLAWDLESGDVRPLGENPVVLPPAGSLALSTTGSRSASVPTPLEPFVVLSSRQTERVVRSTGPFVYRREQPSVLVLDRCRYSISGRPLEGPALVGTVRRELEARAGLTPFESLQPWAYRWKRIRGLRTVPVTMEFEIHSEIDRPNASLVVERGSDFRIRVNGKKVAESGAWLWDRRFELFDLEGLLHRGTNRALLETRFRPGVEIENLLLVGDFATRPTSELRYALVPEPEHLTSDHWTEQGYPFYAGAISYEIPIERRGEERVVLQLERPRGSVFVVRLGGREVAVLAWQPWEADLTESLGASDRSVEISVVSTLQNVFGPLHSTQYQLPRSSWRFSPAVFEDATRQREAFHHEPYGLGPVSVRYLSSPEPLSSDH